MARRSVDSQAALALEAALGPLDDEGVKGGKRVGDPTPREPKVADLVFCAPSGTRTPNPLRSVATFSVPVAMVPIWPVTCPNARGCGLGSTLCCPPFRGDGSGVNRGLGQPTKPRQSPCVCCASDILATQKSEAGE
jgi:hypothetical protein